MAAGSARPHRRFSGSGWQVADRPGKAERAPAPELPTQGQTDLESVLAVSILGPIGIPQEEAVYPQVVTADGKQMNAMHDYVIRMMQGCELPPAGAFWSLTLYDLQEGFFNPERSQKVQRGRERRYEARRGRRHRDSHRCGEARGRSAMRIGCRSSAEDLDLSPQFRVYVTRSRKAEDLDAAESGDAPKELKGPIMNKLD